MINGGGKRYGAILADPPWRFETWSEKGWGNRHAAKHYDVMSNFELAQIPVEEATADNCVLFLWTTDSHLPAAMALGAAWGFTFKTKAFCWIKRTRHGKWHIGMGHWTRANPEDCLLFTRGSPKRNARDVRKLIEAPVREHSRKPDEVYDRIERLVDGPYLELFARSRRAGWDQFGDQAGRWQARRLLGADVPLPETLQGQIQLEL